MGERLGAGFRPEFRVPDLNLRPVEFRNNKIVEKTIQPEEVMTPQQHQNIQEQLDALLRSKDFVHVDEITPRARARNLPRSDFEIVRNDDDKPLTHEGSIVIRNKATREMFAVSSKNLQARPDGTIHYTPSNFAADPKGAQAAAKASANDPHPVATVFQAKQKPETAAQKLAQEQAIVERQAREAAAAAAAKAKAKAAVPKSKAMQQSEQMRKRTSREYGDRPVAREPTEFETSTVAAMAAANMSKAVTSTQQMKAESDRAEAESQQTGSIFAAVTAKQGSAQSNDQQQGHKEQGQQNAEAQKTSEKIRKETTETVTSKTATGGTPGRSKG